MSLKTIFKKLTTPSPTTILKQIKRKKSKIEELEKKVRFEQSFEKKREMENKIDILKEDIVKMGKYAIKEGKLVKNDDAQQSQPQEAQPQPTQPQEAQPQPTQPQQQVTNEGERYMYEQEQNRQKQLEEEIILQRQRNQQAQQAQRQPQYQEQPQQQQQQQQQQQPQQQQYQEQPQQPLPQKQVSIFLSNGERMEVYVPAQELGNFVNELASSINNKTTMQINNRIINGRYVIFYEFN